MRLSRRETLVRAGLTWVGGHMLDEAVTAPGADAPPIVTRGIVLTPADLSSAGWPERAARAGLTTIALHPTPAVVRGFVRSEAGLRFLGECRRHGLEVEYELHAMTDLLPREHYDRDPSLFRMVEDGMRVREHNLCVSSREALGIAAESAVQISRILKPTTGRYFLWGDDGAPWCRCPECRGLSDSDQALLLTNALAVALRKADPRATVAHLAYHNTIRPPAQVKPEPNVFLEFAPIHRRYDVPYLQQTGEAPDAIDLLEANLCVFGADRAQALEYWLDLSRFAGWKRPAPRLPWSRPICEADVDAYARRGVRHITTFGVFLDAEYLTMYGEPPVDEYGAALAVPTPPAGGSRVRRNRTAPVRDSLVDPFEGMASSAGGGLVDRLRDAAEPLTGEPAFDPAEVWRRASALPLPELRASATVETRRLERMVRVGLAHIDLTFRGDHPKYGVGTYAQEEHDGFPPTIIAAADALSQWDMLDRAQTLMAYWLNHFVREDGAVAYYGPSLSEYGQLLSTCMRMVERGATSEWLSSTVKKWSRLAHYVVGLTGDHERPSMPRGVPEADTAEDQATYFHNAAWLVRGLLDWSWVLERRLQLSREASAVRTRGLRLQVTLVRALRDTWRRDPDDWWLRPMAEPEGEGNMARPIGCVTASRLGSYANYRYWPELLSSAVLPDDLARRVIQARRRSGGQYLGMTRFEDRLDDWPLAEYLAGLWQLRMRAEYRYVLWAHALYHQAAGHHTAYEQVTLPPGRKAADYCLPCQLVVARAARRLM